MLGAERERLVDVGVQAGGALAGDPVDEIERDVVESGITEMVEGSSDVGRTGNALEDLEQRRVSLERRREAVEAQTAGLWREFEDEADAVNRLLTHGSTGVEVLADQRAQQGRMRRADRTEPDPAAKGLS